MFDATEGQARELVDLEELNENLANGTIVTDDRRRRPLWFDGRFLDANALSSEQSYFLGRQADIARVAGVGVVHGLNVERMENKARTVTIKAGHGITPAGELVMLQEDTVIDLADIPEIQKLDVSFGVAELPKQAARNRSGLFILALRPVEFTADPIASYPTSINGTRSVEDGNIIEATAVTMIPYPDQGARVELNQRRRHVAREIFLDGSKKGQPTGVLPLAMIALNLGVIQWLDTFMVRREVGARDHDVFGLGLSPRALREAYLQQYYHHLREVLLENGNGSTHVIASDHFTSLPAAGPMPAANINASDFTQAFFPSEMDVDLSIIPDDELPALIEDSYALPPVDLTLTGEEYESTSILVLIPVQRSRVRQLALSLQSLIRPLISAAPGLVAKRKPITALTKLRFKTLPLVPTIVDPRDNLWRAELEGVETLWYIRRRNINYKEDVVAAPLIITREERAIEENVSNMLRTLDLTSAVGNIKRRGTVAAESELMNLLSSPVLLNGSKTAVKAAVEEVSKLETVDRASVVKVVEKFTQPDFGDGISRLEKLDPTIASNPQVVDSIATSGKIADLDKLAKSLTPTELAAFSKELSSVATSGTKAQPKKVATLIENKIATIDPKVLTVAARKEKLSSDTIRNVAITSTTSSLRK